MVMGRLLLVGRLALRDLRRRRTESALLLLAITAATTTLTLGLVLQDAASDPYRDTREATHGPDVVASAAVRANLENLAADGNVTDHSGPFPATGATLRVDDRESDVQAIGRDTAPTSVDQPLVTDGSWVADGGVVVEAAFAAAFGLDVGDRVTLDGRSFTVAGIAVTAAMAPYPDVSCVVPPGCASGVTAEQLARLPAGVLRNPGLVWLTRAAVEDLTATPAYVVGLTLADPAGAPAFVDAHRSLMAVSWQQIRADATEVARDSRILLMIGAWLLGLLAVAGVSVLAGGRMADQTRRVGLLKAVGGTPRLVAAVLLAGHAVVALVAAAAGLAIGSLAAPLVAGTSAGLVGSAGIPSVTLLTAGVVTAVALAVAAAATVVPAVRAARTSTVRALADPARAPRRTGWLIAVSARLPVPLLLALRVAAGRPRRLVLGVVSVAVTVSGFYVALVLDTFLTTQTPTGEYDAAQVASLRQVIVAVMVVLLCLASVNAVVVTWATVLDNRRSSALARALGATPGEVTTALAAAQVLPALVGAVVGVFPGGFLLFRAIEAVTGADSGRAVLPPPWQLAGLVAATVLVVTALTAVPAHLGGRRPVVDAL
jgi:putative ABC transport system permease protein